jgi:hypothetical protein
MEPEGRNPPRTYALVKKETNERDARRKIRKNVVFMNNSSLSRFHRRFHPHINPSTGNKNEP